MVSRVSDRRWLRHCRLVVSGTLVACNGMIPSVALDDPTVPSVAAVGSGRAVISVGVLQDPNAAMKIAVTKKISIMVFTVSVYPEQ